MREFGKIAGDVLLEGRDFASTGSGCVVGKAKVPFYNSSVMNRRSVTQGPSSRKCIPSPKCGSLCKYIF